MSLGELASQFESLAAAASIGGRRLLGLDTNPVSAEWTHITKVDPEGEKQLPVAYPLYLSHTSAVSVGGSRDVTQQNTEETFDLLTDADVPAFHEPSAAAHVTEQTRDQAAFLAIPEVLNGDSQGLVGTLGEGIEYVREDLGPGMVEEKLGFSLDGLFDGKLGDLAAAWLMEEAVFEAYIIMNVDSAAAREANVTDEDLLTPQEARQRALAAEYHLESELVYLEYSGTFGGEEAVELLEAIDDAVAWSRIWYGGGLDSRENAQAVLDAGADAVVVGNVFHEIATTVDVGETSAACYLSTITDLPDPEDRATRYLAAGVETTLALAGIAADLDDPSTAEIREAVADSPPGEDALATVLDGDAPSVATAIAVGLLAERFGLSAGKSFVGPHIGVDL
ncbi:heptaprenylglyceryl phosphate synthase [Halobacteriales archaeon SW_10_66_29]|nr:MAG: heptaprenylglyceryl phosphate synthase [Halobacteriales archaeon SW_10_66_29]